MKDSDLTPIWIMPVNDEERSKNVWVLLIRSEEEGEKDLHILRVFSTEPPEDLVAGQLETVSEGRTVSHSVFEVALDYFDTSEINNFDT